MGVHFGFGFVLWLCCDLPCLGFPVVLCLLFVIAYWFLLLVLGFLFYFLLGCFGLFRLGWYLVDVYFCLRWVTLLFCLLYFGCAVVYYLLVYLVVFWGCFVVCVGLLFVF